MNEKELEIFISGIRLGYKNASSLIDSKLEEPRKIRNYTKGKKKIWTDEDDEIIKKMTDENKTDGEIGKKLGGLSLFLVGQRRRFLGIKKGKGFNAKIRKKNYEGLANLNQL